MSHWSGDVTHWDVNTEYYRLIGQQWRVRSQGKTLFTCVSAFGINACTPLSRQRFEMVTCDCGARPCWTGKRLSCPWRQPRVIVLLRSPQSPPLESETLRKATTTEWEKPAAPTGLDWRSDTPLISRWVVLHLIITPVCCSDKQITHWIGAKWSFKHCACVTHVHLRLAIIQLLFRRQS